MSDEGLPKFSDVIGTMPGLADSIMRDRLEQVVNEIDYAMDANMREIRRQYDDAYQNTDLKPEFGMYVWSAESTSRIFAALLAAKGNVLAALARYDTPAEADD
jgi:hypothetical protein